MKILIKLLLLLKLVVSLASCGEINEEMWLNKDGSGKVEYQFDVGESLPMIMMMVQAGAQQQLSEMKGGEDTQDKMNEIMEKLSSEKLDTSFNFFEFVSDSVKNVTDNPEQFKKMNLFVDLDSEANVALVKMAIDFNDFKEIDQMLNKFAKAFASGSPELANMGIGDMAESFSFDDSNYFTKKEFKQRRMSSGGGGLDGMMNEGEGDQMIEMMFGNTKYSKTIHFPHKIKSVSGADANIDGNTIRIERDFMEMMKEDQSKELEVVFKKKFLGIF